MEPALVQNLAYCKSLWEAGSWKQQLFPSLCGLLLKHGPLCLIHLFAPKSTSDVALLNNDLSLASFVLYLKMDTFESTLDRKKKKKEEVIEKVVLQAGCN